MSTELMKLVQKEVRLNILSDLNLAEERVGVILVDPVNGFVTPGMGALAPPVYDEVIDKMVNQINKLVKSCTQKGLPILILNECHEPDVPEPPYPTHCVRGSGEEKLPPALAWLHGEEKTPSDVSSISHVINVTTVYKNCINGFIGAMRSDGSNEIVEWVNQCQLDFVVVCGICSDICVMQLVQTLLSARNKRFDDGSVLMPSLEEVIVYTEATASYDLPMAIAKSNPDLTEFDAHPRALADFMGLYFMQMSGAVLAQSISIW